jgi:Ion channel
MSAFVTSAWISVVQLALFIVTGLMSLRASSLPRRRVHLLSAVIVAGSVVAASLALAKPSAGAVAAASLWTGLLLLATVVVIVTRILSFTTVTGQSILGAISAYLIVGLMFAAFYAAIAQLHGGHFFADGRPGNSETFQYFSFTTLTTLGYGDFTAAGNDGRAIAVMEALTGQVFLATLVARLVAAFRGPRGGTAGPADAGVVSGSGGSGGSGGAPRGRRRAGRTARRGSPPRWRGARRAGHRDDRDGGTNREAA